MATWNVLKGDRKLAVLETEADAIVWAIDNGHGDGGPDDPYRLAKDIRIVERARTWT